MSRYPWSVSEEPRPSPNPKPRLGLPMDEAPEDGPYDAHAEGKYVCPRSSRCTTCWPEAPQCPACGQSVSCPGSFCSRCEEAAEALPPYDE